MAIVSTWPCTKWPPMRVLAETARSRFSGEECVRDERLVRRRVSGDMPTLKEVGALGGSRAVIVRQVPPGRGLVERVG